MAATQNLSVWMGVHASEDLAVRKNSCTGSKAIKDCIEEMESSALNSTLENDRLNERSKRLRPCGKYCKQMLAKKAVIKFVKDRLPIIKWIPHYSLSNLYYDIIAGITVGLMLVPQSLAYSSLAGLSPEYGLYSSYIGVFLYCFFGTSKDVSIGPVALLCILVEKYTEKHLDTITFASTLALFSGTILVAMAVFRLHFLVSFISVPVLSGFTSAAAVKIAITQIKGVLGIEIPRGSFFETLHHFFNRIDEARVGDAILSITCLVLLLVLRRLSQWNSKRIIPVDASPRLKICQKIIWFLCTTRFTLVVIITTILSQILVEKFDQRDTFVLAGKMSGGIPQPRIPLRRVVEANNATITEPEMVKELSSGFLVTAVIGFLETIAVAKTLARKNRYKLNVTQELFSLGIINIISSFFLSFPVAGSFSRSALNSQCGVRTPLGGLFTGTVVLLALSFLTTWFQYIPKGTLSAMVIAAVIPLFEYKMVVTLWRTKKIDLLPMAVAFFFCFYETEVGILAGVVAALGIFLYQHTQLQLSVRPADGYPLLKIKSQYVYYPSGEQLISKIDKMARSRETGIPKLILVDFENVYGIDSTTAALIKQLWYAMEANVGGPKLRFCNMNADIEMILRKTGIDTLKATESNEEAEVNNRETPFM